MVSQKEGSFSEKFCFMCPTIDDYFLNVQKLGIFSKIACNRWINGSALSSPIQRALVISNQELRVFWTISPRHQMEWYFLRSVYDDSTLLGSEIGKFVPGNRNSVHADNRHWCLLCWRSLLFEHTNPTNFDPSFSFYLHCFRNDSKKAIYKPKKFFKG